MAKWMQPSEEMPDCLPGDRVLMIVRERLNGSDKMEDCLIILDYLGGDRWGNSGGAYDYYGPEDGLLWTYEKDLVKIAEIVCPNLMGN